MAWLSRTGNGMPHNFTKEKPYDMWLEEKTHLKPFIPYAIEAEKNAYTVRQDNSILYKGNYYTLPEGTYKGKGSLVSVMVQNDQVIINDLQNNLICSHELCLEKGKKIINTDHKRDKSKSIDNLLLETAMRFPDYELAVKYLQEVRKRKNRYARDQLSAIKQAILPVAPEVVLTTLNYCLDNAIYNATDFISVLSFNTGKTEQTEFKAPEKISSALSKNISELTPNTSDIINYEQIMKN
jgi:hypothetical protein